MKWSTISPNLWYKRLKKINIAKKGIDIHDFGSSEAFPVWEISSIRDLWYFFKRMVNKMDGEKNSIALANLKASKLKDTLQTSMEKSDFYTHIYGRKVTNSKYFSEIFRIAGWSPIEPGFVQSKPS